MFWKKTEPRRSRWTICSVRDGDSPATVIAVEGPVEKVQQLSLSQGDVLVIQARYALSKEEVRHLEDSLLKETDIKVLVIGPDVTVFSIRAKKPLGFTAPPMTDEDVDKVKTAWGDSREGGRLG